MSSTQIAQLYASAVQYHQREAFAQAEELYLKVLAAAPQHVDAMHNLALVYYQTNRLEPALRTMQQAILCQPQDPTFFNHYGKMLNENGQAEAAVTAFEQGLKVAPEDVDTLFNLANTWLELDQFAQAAPRFRQLLNIAHQHPQRTYMTEALCHCLTHLGNVAHQQAAYLQATQFFQEAMMWQPQSSVLHYNLANALRELGQAEKAASHYQFSLNLNPQDADAHNNLGNVQRELGQLDKSIASYQHALAVNPQLYHALAHLVHQKQHICDWQNLTQEIDVLKSWCGKVPQAQISPFAFLSMPSTGAAEQLVCAQQWVNNRFAYLRGQAKPFGFKARTKTPQHNIKIGYLSADFRTHPLAFLISELIENHDRTRFEIHAYSYGANDASPERARLLKAFDHFHEIQTLSDIEVATQIFEDEIDILVDLTGFTHQSRTSIVALKPAPICVNWLGYPGSMGDLFDYILADDFIIPTTHEMDYAEKVLRLPCYQPNDSQRPVDATPSKAECGLPENSFVFCGFNQSFKITPDVFAVWCRILNATPNSVLWLLDCNPWAKQNLIHHAQTQGIDSTRIIFAPRVPIGQHLARHAHADLFLDTHPYNAHTTCSDALWMNVPVITYTGETFPSRVAGSLLNSLDLSELITANLADYERLAIDYAKNPEKLKSLKQRLADNKAQSALFNTEKFARDLEKIYQEILLAT